MSFERRSARLFFAVLLVIVTFVAVFGRRLLRASEGGDKHDTLDIDGLTRNYLVHIPASYDSKTPVPLLLVLHGATQSADSAERMSGMSAKADKENFLAVYPSGTGRLPTWNSGACCGTAMQRNIDDVSFFRALIRKLEHDYAIDSKRIFVTGISNGAMMSYRLACDMATKSPRSPQWKAPRISLAIPQILLPSSCFMAQTITSFHSTVAQRLSSWAQSAPTHR